MGFLQLPSASLSDASKFTISLWFRVPADTLSAVSAAAAAYAVSDNPYGPDRPIMEGVIPLIVFGPDAVFKSPSSALQTIGVEPEGHWWNCVGGALVLAPTGGPGQPTLNPFPASDITAFVITGFSGVTQPIDPSYIGIDCNGPFPMLAANIVMPVWNASSSEYTTQQMSAETVSTSDHYPCTDPGGCAGTPLVDTQTMTSTDDITVRARPETFRITPISYTFDPRGVAGLENWSNDPAGDDPPIAWTGVRVLPDKWHHILLSFDLTNACETEGGVVHIDITNGTLVETDPADSRFAAGARTTSTSQMWLSFDDVNRTGKQLSAYYPTGYSDVNGILSVNGYACASTFNTQEDDFDDEFCPNQPRSHIVNTALPTYSYTPSAIPFNSGEFGLPAPEAYAANICKVEMAEFQFYGGISLDTGLIENRRLFVDDNGKPVKGNTAAIALGQSPDILLRGSKNWINGVNTGALAESLTPAGTIVQYDPGPHL